MKKPTFIYYLNKDSIYCKIPFLFKLSLFLALSLYVLFYSSAIYNLGIILILFLLIAITGFIKFNKKPFILLLVAITIFTLFWILLSKVDGKIIYYIFPWGTYLTNQTFNILFYSISKWGSIVLAGLLFMIISSEQELIESLNSIKIPKKIIMMISIAFNTVGFTIKDISIVENALEARNYKSNSILKKLKKVLYVGSTLFLSNLKKIDSMNQSYVLREKIKDNASKIKYLKLFIDTFSYNEGLRLINKFGLKIEKGEIISFFGPTGCGKTSLLKIISGIIPNIQKAKFKGKIYIDNKIIDFEHLKEKTIINFQEAEDQFILTKTIDEVFLELDSNEIKKAKELIRYFKVENLINKSLKDISTGQRKLISLITTLSKSREIIILDEPTANLDENFKIKLFNILKDISKEKIIIIGTHDKKLLNISTKSYLYDASEITWKNRDKKYIDVFDKINSLSKENLKKDPKKIIIFDKVSYRYPDETIGLKNISLRINKGDIIGIYGPNGCGKTTIINLLMKRCQPSSGKIINKEKDIALVEQEPQKQLFAISVEEELKFGENNILEKEIKEIMELTKLKNIKGEHPYFISRGQKQLLLISSVLIKKPRIFVIDEPFTGLDNENIIKMVNLLISFNKKYGITIVLTDQNNEILDKITNKQIKLK